MSNDSEPTDFERTLERWRSDGYGEFDMAEECVRLQQQIAELEAKLAVMIQQEESTQKLYVPMTRRIAELEALVEKMQPDCTLMAIRRGDFVDEAQPGAATTNATIGPVQSNAAE